MLNFNSGLSLSRSLAVLIMATSSSSLLEKLEQAGLADRAASYLSVFEAEIDMQATVELHAGAFSEFLQYLEDYVREYVVELPDSTSEWVPIDFIKHLYVHDNNFRFRLLRFVAKLSRNFYRVESDDVVEELGLGNIGNSFLSWDMTLTVMLHEGQGKRANKGKAVAKEVPLVQEEPTPEHNLPEQVEASMALMLLQNVEPVQEDDQMVDPDEIVASIPELDITTLNPIIIDGKEFLFLDDISKSVGLREDEALSTLATTTTLLDEGETMAAEPALQIDFEDHSLTKSLEYISYDTQRTSEETVAAALVAIQDAAADYQVPKSAFHPHSTFASTKVDHAPGYDIQLGNVVQVDDAMEV